MRYVIVEKTMREVEDVDFGVANKLFTPSYPALISIKEYSSNSEAHTSNPGKLVMPEEDYASFKANLEIQNKDALDLVELKRQELYLIHLGEQL